MGLPEQCDLGNVESITYIYKTQNTDWRDKMGCESDTTDEMIGTWVSNWVRVIEAYFETACPDIDTSVEKEFVGGSEGAQIEFKDETHPDLCMDPVYISDRIDDELASLWEELRCYMPAWERSITDGELERTMSQSLGKHD